MAYQGGATETNKATFNPHNLESNGGGGRELWSLDESSCTRTPAHRSPTAFLGSFFEEGAEKKEFFTERSASCEC